MQWENNGKPGTAGKRQGIQNNWFFLFVYIWKYWAIGKPVIYRKSHQGFLKICSKFTGEHPCQSVISIKLLCDFIEITLRQRCSPVNLLHIFTYSYEHLWTDASVICDA